MVPIFYSPQYVGASYAFETTRKAQWVADSLQTQPLAGLQLVEPPPLTMAQLTAVHDDAYIRAIQTGQPAALANSPELEWDAAMWPMVLASNGGVVAAARAALEQGLAGSLSSGLHHARRAAGAGYCTFNGLVIAAYEALAAGAQNVLILDLDAHCGGGTASLIAADTPIWQIDISTDGYDQYEATERLWLEVISNGGVYLATIQKWLTEADRQGLSFDLCLYNAGVDCHADCPMGGIPGITLEVIRAREQLVLGWCQQRRLPLAFVLAGGYIGPNLDEQGLVALHREVLHCANQKPSVRW